MRARSSIDAEVQSHLKNASRALASAERTILAFEKSRERDGGPDPVLRQRSRRMASKIQVLIRTLSDLGQIQPIFDMEDPDLVPEKDKRPPTIPRNWFQTPVEEVEEGD